MAVFRAFACAGAHRQKSYDSSGDQAGSEAKLGVGTFSSLWPVRSMVQRLRAAVAPGIAEEHDHAPVRREGRAFVVEALGEDALAGAVRLDDADRELPVQLTGEGDVDRRAATTPASNSSPWPKLMRCAGPPSAAMT